MMSAKADLCRRLDALVLDFFTKLSELDGKKAQMESLMAEGFIQLSKTRYNLGSGVGNSIGAVMYDRAHMTAGVKVVQCRDDDDDDDDDDAAAKDGVDDRDDDDDKRRAKYRLISGADLNASTPTPSKPSSSSNVRIHEGQVREEKGGGRGGGEGGGAEEGEREGECGGGDSLSLFDGLRQRKGASRSRFSGDERDELTSDSKSRHSTSSSSKTAAASSSLSSSSSSASSSTEKADDDAIENLGKAVCDLKVSPDGMMELQTMKPPTSPSGAGSPNRSSTTPTHVHGANDPIRWFGILVPQSLKLSQRNFKSCLELVVEIANLQLEIGQLQAKFKRLVKKKNAMMAGRRDDDPDRGGVVYDGVDVGDDAKVGDGATDNVELKNEESNHPISTGDPAITDRPISTGVRSAADLPIFAEDPSTFDHSTSNGEPSVTDHPLQSGEIAMYD